MASAPATNLDTQVALKIIYDGSTRRFKLPLREMGPNTLPDRLRFLLSIPPTSDVVFERYSDSLATFVTLDPNNASVYKQLYRAAKAKLKLRIKVTATDKTPVVPKPATVEVEIPSTIRAVEDLEPRSSMLEPVIMPTTKATSAVSYPEKPIYPGSVSELQRGFEQLLINHPRHTFTAPAAPVVASSTPIPAPSQEKAELSIEPTPSGHGQWFAEYTRLSPERQTDFWKSACPALNPAMSIYSVYCNNCNDAIPDVHYHCSTCEDGDFDLCQTCVSRGVVCGSDEHWLIKRFIQDGKVTNSTTETIAPKRSFSASKTTLVAVPEPKITAPTPTRTCNSCIAELPENQFVTCASCADFDLCIPCHLAEEHGHHPKHAFAPAVEDTNLNVVAQALLAPGRNVSHNAICDGCDRYIYGVRHKCLACPDWDYCSSCIVNASFIHPEHRFAPIYEPLADATTFAHGFQTKVRHHGIYCDGPLCNTGHGPQSIIKGDRYKCAVCHDTDFCASCEASPANGHNKTHPLIKFKTPVRNVSVTTLGDHEDGKPMPVMGDRRGRTTTKSTETNTNSSTNAATQVQTVADFKPLETAKTEERTPEIKPEPKELPTPVVKKEYVAHFVRDIVVDGNVMPGNTVFEQTWYLRNAGDVAWPAGCSVKFVGGDNMCAVDPEHPASVHELVSAAESTTVYTEVAPGQEVGFTVLMRTPGRIGNFISYWRLTGPDGEKFGHRLWCDINVKEAAPVKTETKEKEASSETETQDSQMIFPKLEKESPSTSIHEERSVSAPVASTRDEAEEFDDFGAEFEDEETEDGFMTDEEYDILDASDEEYLAEQSKAVRK